MIAIIVTMQYGNIHIFAGIRNKICYILVGWIVKPVMIIEEMEKSGCKLGRNK